LIYDFDYMPGPECDAVVQALVAGPPACKVVVHGYNVDDLRTRELESSGVIVLRHLVPNFIRRLRFRKQRRLDALRRTPMSLPREP
jgi:hypothetical protein